MRFLHLLAWLACVTPWLAHAQAAPAVPESPAPAGDQMLIDQGRYLATAGDCLACHTAKDGPPYAGGYSVQSPLGAIYATNITPSKTAGIGNYTEAQFARALREGIRGDGAHLYPAMPYTAYASLTDEDVHALYTYFMKGVPAVDEKVARTELPFPFNIRISMAAWNLMFLDDTRFKPDTGKSEQINRGAYLANGLAHCSTCHTPRNALMAEKGSRFLGGGQLGAWYAPNITPDESGIGGWTDAELLSYLKTGRAEGKAQAAGPMAEAVEKSFQHMTSSDLEAIVAYLRTVKPVAGPAGAQAPFAQGKAHSPEPALRGMSGPNEHASLTTGAALFSAHCASCHQADGAGTRTQFYPALFRNTATGGADPSNLVAVILYGVERSVGDEHVLMPRFDQLSYVSALSDDDVASIANYVLAEYGNARAKVSRDDVAQARRGGPTPLLAKVQPFIVWGVGILALLVLLLIVLGLRRRRGRARERGAV
jgi:mono/diheme cytochrome c family protein